MQEIPAVNLGRTQKAEIVVDRQVTRLVCPLIFSNLHCRSTTFSRTHGRILDIFTWKMSHNNECIFHATAKDRDH